MKIKTTYIFSILFAIAMLASCYSNNCPLNNSVTCNYHFYDMEGNAIKYGDQIKVSTLKPGMKDVWVYKKLGYKTLTLDSPDSALVADGYSETKTQQRKDTVIVGQANSDKIQIPMSYYYNCDTLVFEYGSISKKDTIKINHESYPHVELPECGTYRFHSLKGISCTNAAIDHVEISNPVVNFDGAENIKIYFNGVAEQ
ncbi:MAG: hypothetical protein KBT29_00835 [Prevotellaceae bacterium]|nr:hypothetical protein [Candidatus Minthosoma caballi]